jgi:hypothetical protein
MVQHIQIKMSLSCNNTTIQAHKTQCKSHKLNAKKNLQQQNMCVLESQITKSDLRSHNLRLHPIH